MLSCVLPSRVAWPLDRQTSRNWAGRDPGVGRPTHACQVPPRAQSRDPNRFHQFVARQSGKAHAGACVLALSLLIHVLVCQPCALVVPTCSGQLPGYLMRHSFSLLPACIDGRRETAALQHAVWPRLFLFQLGRDQRSTAHRSTAGTSTTSILLDLGPRRDVVIANPGPHWPTTQIPAPLSFFYCDCARLDYMYSPKGLPLRRPSDEISSRCHPAVLPTRCRAKKNFELNSHALHRGRLQLAVSGVRPARTTSGRSDLDPPFLSSAPGPADRREGLLTRCRYKTGLPPRPRTALLPGFSPICHTRTTPCLTVVSYHLNSPASCSTRGSSAPR